MNNKVDNKIHRIKITICPTCNGKGIVLSESNSLGIIPLIDSTIAIQCLVCSGSGYISRVEENE